MSEPTVTTEPTASAVEPPVELPADHPLVKTLAVQKAELKSLKEKASRLDQIEADQKTAEQRAAEREAAAEARAVEAEARALRREIALEHKLSREDAGLLDAIKDEDAIRALAARLAKADDGKPRSGNYVPNEGRTQTTTTDERRAFVRKLTGRE